MGSASSSQQGGTTDSAATSTSTTRSWNEADATNSSFARGVTGSQGTSGQSVWNPQRDVLGDIYHQADMLAGGRGRVAGQAAGVSRDARSAWEQSLQPGGNPYFSQNVQGAIDQATQNFKRQVVPGLTEAGVGAGAYGTSRDALARGEAAGLAQQGIQNMVGGMYADQYNTDAAARTAALGMAPQIQGMTMAPLTTAAGVVGGPTVLGSSQTSSFGSNTGGSYGESSNTGGSLGTSKSRAVSHGTSSGEGNSIGVGGK